MSVEYVCPPECKHHPDDDPIRCPKSTPSERCFIHGIAYSVYESCPTCSAYIAAGL